MHTVLNMAVSELTVLTVLNRAKPEVEVSELTANGARSINNAE